MPSQLPRSFWIEHFHYVRGTFMSPWPLIFVLVILWVPVIAIYVTLFSVGSGFEDKAEKTAAPPAKTESKSERHEIRHAA
jgi:hypothetical protein